MKNLAGFLLESEKLKMVLRQTKPIHEDRYENSAEHSWQAALAGMVLLEYAPPHVNHLTVLKMLIIHDIVEIDAGDVFVYDEKARSDAFEAEAEAATRIFGLLDAPLGSDLLALWHEFEEKQTPEAKFAKAIDRVMPVLQNLNSGGQSWCAHGIKRHQVLAKNAEIENASPALWAYLKTQIEKSPHLAD